MNIIPIYLPRLEYLKIFIILTIAGEINKYKRKTIITFLETYFNF